MLPTGTLTPDAYLRDRVQGQLEWYRSRSVRHERTRVVLSALIFAANVLAALLALVALFGGSALEPWVAVVTTMVGVLTTYMALTAADFLANSYASTARHLAELEKAWRQGEYGPEPEGFHNFVRQVEQVISREHSGWTAVVRHASERAS
jgi:hypothetical protein